MTEHVSIGRLPGDGEAYAYHGPDGWGIGVTAPGRSSARQPRPMCAEVWRGGREPYEGAYERVTPDGSGLVASGRLAIGNGASLAFEDRWDVSDGVLQVDRRVRVDGDDAEAGFSSAVSLVPDVDLSWPDVDTFVPGMVYGWNERLAPQAIGNVAHYLRGVRDVRIREDRMPAPLFGVALRDGTSITVLDPSPDGTTTRDDGLDLEGTALVDRRFAFAALGGSEQGASLSIGLWFPGTEGEITYLADTPFADGQFGKNARRSWRGRYHPVESGFEHTYRAAFRFGASERDQDFRRNVWRWAWNVLEPKVEQQDIETARRVLAEALEASIQRSADRAAPAHVVDAVSGKQYDRPVMMGFTGRAIETGTLLLKSLSRLDGVDAERRRERAVAVLETFARLPVSPPQAEGLHLGDGTLTSGVRPDFYLRALCEGGAFMLRAYEFERSNGEERAHWLAWCRGLADWLLSQERPDGGFPRSWQDITAEVVDADPSSSYAVVPFLVALSRVTGEPAYGDAALRAAELCWALHGSRGYFVGGTLDNANVVDKEAGTLTLEAHLVLYAATGDARWLTRARDAADFAETWVYLWNVPMAPDDVADDLHWKHGVSTIGSQLIATGHSLTDAYMAWDVASYAKLAVVTGDEHYLDVARLLLHNTKTMLAMPGRTFDLCGPGWQQEHWSFAPPRGRGQHRHWLPWVACSHLEGIDALESLDPALFQRLMRV